MNMFRFSERKGYKAIRVDIQKEYIDIELRSRLWNVISAHYFEHMNRYSSIRSDKNLFLLFSKLWDIYFKDTVDTMPITWHKLYSEIREYYFKCDWYEVYDFIEFIATNFPLDTLNKRFMDSCNYVLKSDLSGYRFLDGKIIEITSEEELKEIEQATTIPLSPVKLHLETAIKLFADRKAPEYRNSIKESISAVESFAKLITKNDKASLEQALKKFEKSISLHPALKSAFSKLYGYTSDENGIRHCLMDLPTIDFEDAKYMLVACSAFINYLYSKLVKIGFKL